MPMIGIGLGLSGQGGAGGSEASATVSQTAISQSGADLSEYAFANQAIGENGGSDVIYIAFGATSVADATAVSAITVDGVAADEVEQTNYPDVFVRISALYAIDRIDLPDPDQTDVDVVITLNGGATRAACALLVSPNAVKTAFSTASAINQETDLSVNTPAGGIVIAACYMSGTGDTWTGMDDTADIIVDGTNLFSTAIASGVISASPREISVDAGGDIISAVAASFAVA